MVSLLASQLVSRWKRRRRQQRSVSIHVYVAGCLAMAVLCVASTLRADDAASNPDSKVKAVPFQQSGNAAARAYKDPKTGLIGAAPAELPAGDAVVPAERDLNTSSEGLVETQGVTAAGGVKADLNGRFLSEETATRDASGKVVSHCGGRRLGPKTEQAESADQ
jgi:hypothetical protein